MKHSVGVALSLFDVDGNLYMLHRTKDDLYALPGGRLENEEPRVGLSREVREEFGIDVSHETMHPFGFAHGYHGEAKDEMIIMLYFGVVLPMHRCRMIRNAEPHKHSGIVSVAMPYVTEWSDTLKGKYWPTDRKAAEQAFAYFF